MRATSKTCPGVRPTSKTANGCSTCTAWACCGRPIDPSKPCARRARCTATARTWSRKRPEQVQHLQGALDQMNLKLHFVLNDLTGLTGQAVLEATSGGERDPQQLAKLRDRRVKAAATA